MSIVTRGFVEGNLVSRGYGTTLVVIIDPKVPPLPSVTGGGLSLPKVIKDLIQTRRIVVDRYKKSINVDVIFVNADDLEKVRVYAQQLGYKEIEVVFKDEVTLID